MDVSAAFTSRLAWGEDGGGGGGWWWRDSIGVGIIIIFPNYSLMVLFINMP